MFKYGKILISSVFIFIFFSKAYADQPDWVSSPRPWVFSLGIGHYMATMTQQTDQLQTASDEIDPMIKTGGTTPFAAFNSSIGYEFLSPNIPGLHSTTFFLGLEYLDKATITGDRYQNVVDPDFLNWTYKITDTSTKFILGAQENFDALFNKKITPFVLFGFGVVDDNVSYKDDVTAVGLGSPALTLASKNQYHLFYRLGAGLGYEINPAWQINSSVTYDVQPNVTTGTGYTSATPAVAEVTISPVKLQWHLGASYRF